MGRPWKGLVNESSLEEFENVKTKIRLSCVALTPVGVKPANGFL